MPLSGIPHFVFTYDPMHQEAAALAQVITERKLMVWPSRVSGVVPELRTGLHDFVRGIGKVKEFLNKEFELKPQL